MSQSRREERLAERAVKGTDFRAEEDRDKRRGGTSYSERPSEDRAERAERAKKRRK